VCRRSRLIIIIIIIKQTLKAQVNAKVSQMRRADVASEQKS